MEHLPERPPDAVLPPRERLHMAALHRLLGFDFVDFGDRYVVLSMPVRTEAFNSTGNVHGGAIATLIDVASGQAAWHHADLTPGEHSLVTADLHVRYLGRPRGDMVYARAEITKAGRTLIVIACTVTDSDERVIAAADSSMMIIGFRPPLRPSPADGPDL